MKFIYLFFIAIIALCFNSCGGDKGSGNRPFGGGGGQQAAKCQHTTEPACDQDSLYCAWNVDTCVRKFEKYAPKLPANLGTVKMVAVAESVCAIDSKDELWCIPGSIIRASVYPHKSKKYRHVAMVPNYADEGICATTMDGKGVCFDRKGKEKAGPTEEKVLETIPYAFGETKCAFSAKKLFCESKIKSVEKLDKFSNDPAVFTLAKLMPTDSEPSLAKIGFKAAQLGSEKKIFFALFDNKIMLTAIEDSTKTNLWDTVNNAKAPYTPITFKNVVSLSTFENAHCFVIDGTKGVSCGGGNYHDDKDIPDDVKNADLAQVSTSNDHVCVVLKDTGELKCWGNKKQMKNIPKNVTGVKQVAVSERLTCYIDKNDKLHCVDSEE